MTMMHTDDDDNRDSPLSYSYIRIYNTVLRSHSFGRLPRSIRLYARIPAAIYTRLRTRATAGSNSERDCPILNFHSVQSVGRPGPFVRVAKTFIHMCIHKYTDAQSNIDVLYITRAGVYVYTHCIHMIQLINTRI